MRVAPTVGSLFSGIGGLDLGLERAGFRIAWQCESDPYARAVLRKHWPDVPCYPDVRALDGREPAIDVLCGGFPCQPVSVAGKRRAQADPRWLWPAFAAVVRSHRPALVLLENVPGLRTAGLRDVLADLAALGFDAEWTVARASDVGAPHLRARLFVVATDADRAELRLEPGWLSRAYRAATHELGVDGAAVALADAGRVPSWHECGGADGHATERGEAGDHVAGRRAVVADPDRDGWEGAEHAQSRERTSTGRRRFADARGPGHLGDAASTGPSDGAACAERLPAFARELERSGWWATEPDVGRVAHGVPARVDRLRCLGTAVVPQVAEWIGHALMRRWQEHADV